jgi:hypothetical protein
MFKALMTIFMGVMVSFYFFPIEFTFLPGINTKMAMAGFGLVILMFQLARKEHPHLDKSIFSLSLIACLISLLGFISITYNETPDYTYATYIVSMWVWLSAAYVITTFMRAVHGYISVELICNYLIAVCTAQCISALMIDSIPAFKEFVDTYVSGFGFVDTSKINHGKRMYGIGAGLDVAGLRFSCVLCGIAYITSRIANTARKGYLWIYLVCFIIISLVGNMIARTTTIGVGLALCYWTIRLFTAETTQEKKSLWGWLLGIIIASLLIIVPLYNTNPNFKANTRFAFEGFFSLVEKGRWEVRSNEILLNMYVFPDNLKTWLIGDGYIENPIKADPYYTGEVIGGYYMGTDVGYLRFIFYFGVFGLLALIAFFITITRNCIKQFPSQRALFVLILAVNLIGWFKVSTDIFLAFAPFLLICREEGCELEQHIDSNVPT